MLIGVKPLFEDVEVFSRLAIFVFSLNVLSFFVPDLRRYLLRETDRSTPTGKERTQHMFRWVVTC